MTFPARVTTITQDVIVPSAVDAILGDNFITFRVVSNGQKWNGETLKRPIKVSKSTLGGSFSGLDTHSTATVDTRVLASADLRGYEMPIAIPGMEKAVNKTEAQVLDLVKIEVESAQEDAMDDLGDMFYADGTGNGSKDFNGWDLLIDDGTVSATLHGLTRATYTPNWDSDVNTAATLDLDALATIVSSVSAGSSQKNQPSFAVSNETTRDYYESLLTPTVRANYETFGLPVVTRTSKSPMRSSELKGANGFTSMSYRGIPWVADEKCPSGDLWLPNESYVLWYGLKDSDLKDISLQSSGIEGVYNDAPSSNIGFQWTDFMVPVNQYGIVAHIYLLGNQVNWNPKRSGKLEGIAGV
jgi:hypothetical protein